MSLVERLAAKWSAAWSLGIPMEDTTRWWLNAIAEELSVAGGDWEDVEFTCDRHAIARHDNLHGAAGYLRAQANSEGP